MDFSTLLLFFFSALGALNGLFLSAYFAFFVTNKTRSTYLLSALFFVVSVRVTKSVFFIFYDDISNNFIQLGLSACMLIGPFLYLYILESTNPKKYHRFGYLLHIVPVLIGMMFVGYFYPYSEHRYLWRRTLHGYLYWILFIQWFVYIALAYVLLKSSYFKLFLSNKKLNDTEIWLTTVTGGITLIWLAYFTSNYTSYIVGALSFSFVLYSLILLLILKRKNTALFFETPERYFSKKITTAEEASILEKLKIAMLDKKLYKNSDFKLQNLADELAITTHYLSQFLNDNLQKSFAQYINELRVEEAKSLLKDYDHFTLEAIGNEAGFNSKSTFYAVFKKITGITPATFKKQIK